MANMGHHQDDLVPRVSRTTPAPAQQRSKLLDLPTELLNRIIVDQKVYGKGDRRNMRLVCRAFDDSVKAFTLSVLRLSSLNMAQLLELASSHSGFEEYATHLRFGGVIQHEDNEATDSAVAERLAQEILCQVIVKMKRVKSVYFVSPLVYHTPLLQTIGELPSLEDIHIYARAFESDTMGTIASAVASLKSIYISGWVGDISDAAMEHHLSSLLIRNPQVIKVQLEAGVVYDRHTHRNRQKYYDFSAIVTPIITQSHFRPSLQHINACSLLVLPTSGCLAFLANMTSLCISTIDQSDTLWPALHAVGIRLQHLTVDGVTGPLVRYLLRYVGLKTFRVDGRGDIGHWNSFNPLPPPDRHEAERLFDEALPNHDHSLTGIGILFRNNNWGWGIKSVPEPWSVDAKQLERLGRLPKLETLELTVCFDDSDRCVGISMEEVLNSIFIRLAPSLCKVTLCSSTILAASVDAMRLAIVDHEFKDRPLNLGVQLWAASMWFIAYDEDRQVYKFDTTSRKMRSLLSVRDRGKLKCCVY